MSSLADITAYMAMLSREDTLHELNDKFFYFDTMITCRFGLTSEFYFIATDRPEMRDTMVDLAERYYDAAMPAKSFIVVEEASKNLTSAKDIAPFVKRGRYRWRYEDPSEPISFYVRGIEPDTKNFDPSPVDFNCIIDAINYTGGGHLRFNKYLVEKDSNIADYVDLFVETCRKIDISYAVSGCALLYGSYTSRNPEICYPLYKRFPGLLYADTVGFGLEINRQDDVIRDVNWLTAVGANVLAKHPSIVEAIDGAPADIKVHRYEGGIVLQAGARPAIGDFNLGVIPPAYREVNRILRPARFEGYTGPYLRVPDIMDGNAATREWITRFD